MASKPGGPWGVVSAGFARPCVRGPAVGAVVRVAIEPEPNASDGGWLSVGAHVQLERWQRSQIDRGTVRHGVESGNRTIRVGADQAEAGHGLGGLSGGDSFRCDREENDEGQAENEPQELRAI